jgi:phospholipase C
MSGLTRRRFLGGAAGGAGALGLGVLPPKMQKLLARTKTSGARRGSLRDVKHVVFLMQENRTFDHYFGTLSGVRGFSDPDAITLSTGRSVFYQPDAVSPDGYELPFRLDTTTTSGAFFHSPDNGWVSQHQAWDGGRNDAWLPAQRAAAGPATGPLTMGYYTREDLPFHYGLADAFTVCDNYFTSVLGQSTPNHVMALSGTIDPAGLAGGPVLSNADYTPPKRWPTLYDTLQAAGISWREYIPFGGGEAGIFEQFQNAPPGSPLYENGMKIRPRFAFVDDVLHDRLPQFSRLHTVEDEHPGSSLPGGGAEDIYTWLEALASNPEVWAKTVLFITWDDAGGLFDHVVPPTAPAGTAGEWVTVNPLPADAGGIAGPVGLGFRVPMLVISPWSTGGWVSSQTFDHTSVIRFCETLFGVRQPTISAWRRQTVGDLTSALRLQDPNPAPLGEAFSALPDAMVQFDNQLSNTFYSPLPPPAVPTTQTLPQQEPGQRPHTS